MRRYPTWADVQVGTVVLLEGGPWQCIARSGAEVSMRRESDGHVHTAVPREPDQAVTVVEITATSEGGVVTCFGPADADHILFFHLGSTHDSPEAPPHVHR